MLILRSGVCVDIEVGICGDIEVRGLYLYGGWDLW